MGEYDLHMKRNGQPYSRGHRLRYDAAIGLLSGMPASVLEVGVGIGYGLDLMLRSNMIRKYIGFEPDRKSFDYAAKQNDDWRVKLINRRFEDCQSDITHEALGGAADYGFCIEVLEHLDDANRLTVLRQMRVLVDRGVFLSTPNRMTSTHGKMTPDEVAGLMDKAGFRTSWVEWQWTTFFIGKCV